MWSKKWTFYHRYLIVLKSWNVDRGLDEDSFSLVPVWIQLPGLPPRLWTTPSLSGIISFVGKPLATDTMTLRRARMDYATVLVEVDQRETHPVEIPIILPGGGTIRQKIVYEWKAKKCGACGLVGHEAGQCRRRRWPQPDEATRGTGQKNAPEPVAAAADVPNVQQESTSDTVVVSAHPNGKNVLEN